MINLLFVNKILVIAGPTGVGKTYIAHGIAKKLSAEIINADSLQIYKYLDIGTAKPSPDERKEVPYHLIDLIEPNEEMNAYRYAQLASEAIKSVWSKNKLPIVVGGSGLYLKALLNGLPPRLSSNKKIREELAKKWEISPYSLYKELVKIDPETADSIHPHDKFRIIRALEIFYLTKSPPSSVRKKRKPFIEGDVLKIFLIREKRDLYFRIKTRAIQMMKKGLIQETKSILEAGYSADLKPLQSIGYKEAVLILEGKLSYSETIRLMIKRTKQYAKRQITWFKKEKDFIWINLTKNENPQEIIDKWIEGGQS